MFPNSYGPRSIFFLMQNISARKNPDWPDILSLSSKISATVKLWDGSTCLKTWTDSGTGVLSFSEAHSKDIKSGKSYKMTVDYTIAGKSYPQLPTSAVYRG